MVIRARLSAPQPKRREEWPYHKTEWVTIPTRLLGEVDRRLEAETYLATGYGIRLAIESRAAGWVRLRELSSIWQPSRLKGIQVGPDVGTPFLAATQVFDIRPIPRKWLSMERTHDAKTRFVERATILVTCSGSVGRATLAFSPHRNTLITHDLLRIQALTKETWGWLYAYLRAPKVRAMMTGSHYGHIIKHLEVSHLNALPIPRVSEALMSEFNLRVNEILDLRERAYAASLKAEARFEQCLGSFRYEDGNDRGFVLRASKTMFLSGKRLDASRHNPLVIALQKHLQKNGRAVNALSESGFAVWVPGRYKRIPASEGVVFVDSSDLFEINPDTKKRFADCRFGDNYRGRVRPGWLLMASSGQVYGVIGGVVLASDFYNDKVVANHVIRIAARDDATARPGYVLTALSHPILGRPLVKSLAFGSSVPEISPEDIARFGLVRLAKRDEDLIADFAEESTLLRGKADILETQLAENAEQILDDFISGNRKDSF